MDRSQIGRYAAGVDLLHHVIEGLSPAELNAPPPPGSPGTWTLQQIVVHVMDSDLASAHRMRRVIAEEKPPLVIAYDESAFAKNLFYDRTDARLAADIYRLNRALMTDLLRRLPDSAFRRFAIHNEHGKVTLADFVRMYADHTEHHVRFAREKRRRMGRPMR
jgi:hypothetical protein